MKIHLKRVHNRCTQAGTGNRRKPEVKLGNGLASWSCFYIGKSSCQNPNLPPRFTNSVKSLIGSLHLPKPSMSHWGSMRYVVNQRSVAWSFSNCQRVFCRPRDGGGVWRGDHIMNLKPRSWKHLELTWPISDCHYLRTPSGTTVVAQKVKSCHARLEAWTPFLESREEKNQSPQNCTLT